MQLALAPVAGSPFAGFLSPNSVTVDPSGKFAYVAKRDAANVAAFTIEASGALTAVPGSPYLTGQGPFSVIVDSSGFASTANQISNTVSTFRIDATNGALTPSGTPIPTGRGPVSLAITRALH